MLRGIGGAAQPLPMEETLPELVEGRVFSIGNGAGRDPRNPGKPVENGLFVDFRDKMQGRACEITVRKRKIWRGDCRFFAFLPIIC